jgi:hypothetical protein
MNKNAKIILVLFAVLIAVILAGCVQEKAVPSAPIEVCLAISNAPALNQTAELTCTITSREDAPDTTAQIKLPEGFELISGNLTWKGDLEKNSQKSFKATVKSVKTGNWAIEAIAEAKSKEGEPSESYKAVDHVYVVLENVTASVSKTPPTITPSKDTIVVNRSDIKTMRPRTYAEAIKLANDYLNETLGSSFVNEHFECLGIEEIDFISWWSVVYKYRSNEYEMNMTVGIDCDTMRIDTYQFMVITTPQEIKLSPEDAEAIASDKGLESPTTEELAIEEHTNRIAWIVTAQKKPAFMEPMTYFIDAENGDILSDVKYYRQAPIPEKVRNRTKVKYSKFIPYSEIITNAQLESAKDNTDKGDGTIPKSVPTVIPPTLLLIEKRNENKKMLEEMM